MSAAIDEAAVNHAQGSPPPPAKKQRVEAETSAVAEQPAAASSSASTEKPAAAATAAAQEHDNVAVDSTEGTSVENLPLDADANAAPEASTSKASSDRKGKGRDKFVPVHGNYKGYYTKRRFNQDPYAGDDRLALIPKEWMEDKRVLDVGCNVGKVTIEIAQSFGAYRVTGVDIDAELVQRAQRQIRIAWSTQEPLTNIQEAARKERKRPPHRRRSMSRSPAPIDAEDAVVSRPSHFPEALPRMFGFLPNCPSDRFLKQYVRPTEQESKERSQRRDGKRSRGNVMPKEKNLFPLNLRFKRADWVNQEIQPDKKGYDCILALSVSKWIHLNGGDDGLMEFFTRVFTTLHPSGRFILEPQPWSSYAKASRMSDELKQSYNSLKLRPDDFERVLLQDIGFQKMERLGKAEAEADRGGERETATSGFERPLHVYYKAAGSWL